MVAARQRWRQLCCHAGAATAGQASSCRRCCCAGPQGGAGQPGTPRAPRAALKLYWLYRPTPHPQGADRLSLNHNAPFDVPTSDILPGPGPAPAPPRPHLQHGCLALGPALHSSCDSLRPALVSWPTSDRNVSGSQSWSNLLSFAGLPDWEPRSATARTAAASVVLPRNR